jgi:hypothetical protein
MNHSGRSDAGFEDFDKGLVRGFHAREIAGSALNQP